MGNHWHIHHYAPQSVIAQKLGDTHFEAYCGVPFVREYEVYTPRGCSWTRTRVNISSPLDIPPVYDIVVQNEAVTHTYTIDPFSAKCDKCKWELLRKGMYGKYPDKPENPLPGIYGLVEMQDLLAQAILEAHESREWKLP